MGGRGVSTHGQLSVTLQDDSSVTFTVTPSCSSSGLAIHAVSHVSTVYSAVPGLKKICVTGSCGIVVSWSSCTFCSLRSLHCLLYPAEGQGGSGGLSAPTQ
jgi:hypothetical protein